MSVSKNTIKKIGHCACLGDIMGQTHHIYARIGTNHARHFIVPLYLVHGLKNITVFSECARTHSPDTTIFMRSARCAVQN